MSVKLPHLIQENLRRQQIAKYYLENIQNPAIILPSVSVFSAHVWHLFVIRSKNRDALQKHLAKQNIQTLIHYPIPPHHQDCYSQWKQLSFPITEGIHQEILSLPISPVMDEYDVESVVTACNMFTWFSIGFSYG